MSSNKFSPNKQKKSSKLRSALKGVGNILGLRIKSNKEGELVEIGFNGKPTPSSYERNAGSSKFYIPNNDEKNLITKQDGQNSSDTKISRIKRLEERSKHRTPGSSIFSPNATPSPADKVKKSVKFSDEATPRVH